MTEMAGVVVGHSRLDRVPRRDGLQVGEQLADVAHLGGERGRPFGVLRVVAQQPAVLLHGGAAAGHVHHDRVDVGAVESVDETPGPFERLRLAAGVLAERAAAALASRRPDLAALRGSTRTVAALTSRKNTRWTQPVSKATRRRGRCPPPG